MEFNVLQKTYIDDGYGGKVPTTSTVESIYGKVSPYRSESELKNQGRIVTTGVVVYTNSKIKAQGEIFIEVDGVVYDVIDKIEEKRKGVYTCELKSR